MSGKDGKVAFTASENKPYVSYLPASKKALLVVAYHPGDGLNIVIILQSGQFGCGPTECKVKVKLDHGKPFYKSFFFPDDGSTDKVLTPSSYDFLSKILSAKTLYVEVPIYQSGQQVLQFNVEGLKWEKPFVYATTGSYVHAAYFCNIKHKPYPAKYLSKSEMAQVNKANR
ncbi:MAG: hypothetical protein P8Y36_14920 [Alphaproteobacteria bacterium]